ncbi:MAG: helix-hairpin-helix domain-containing protein [Sphingobacteriales bacterium]|nr:MAG: helix-hairpin-helix domain-containing protein [Sphingobacteriales bacterium]
MYNIIIAFFCIYASAEKCFGQQADKEIFIQQIIEARVEETDDEVDFTDLQYWLNYYYENPLDLNKADAEALQNLFILSQIQIQSIINHRKQFGDFISIIELQSVENLDINTIEKILPFVKIGNNIEDKNFTVKQLFTQGKNEILLRYSETLENQSGYTYQNPKYKFQGAPYGLQLRYNYRFGNSISYGFTAEKDAGEQFFRGTQKQGFDFYSAHFFYTGNKFIKTLALGDYQVQFGQGLTIWSSLSFGKSANVMNIARQARGIFPSRGTNEFQFFRGAATSFDIKKFKVSIFGSQKNIDANALSDTFSDRAVEVSSLLLGGYHRNEAELEDKRTLTERATGGEILFHQQNFKIGISGIYGAFSAPVSPDEKLYSIYNTSGKYFGNAGISYTYLYKNAYLFGEISRSLNGGNAMLHGVLLSLHPKLDFGLLYRNFSPKYNANYSAAFSESSKNINEKGTYLAASYKFSSFWKLDAYADIFSFPWLRYRVDAPSKGYEYLGNLTFQPNKKWQGLIRYRLQNKDINSQISADKIHQPVPADLHQLRFQLNLNVSDRISLRSRAEFSSYKEIGFANENGFMAFQDINYSFYKIPVSITARYTFFDIDSYNARIYTYENDVRFAYSVPALQDEGIRSYLLIQYKPKRKITLYGRISRTQLYNKQTISSGLTEIKAPHRTEVKFQVQYNF